MFTILGTHGSAHMIFQTKSCLNIKLKCICVIIRTYKVPGRIQHLINFSKVPKVDFESDVKEVFGRGSGPGGQNVNKSKNQVTLIHEPTKIYVKSHETRSLEKNRIIAREKLIDKLDHFFNKEESVEAQVEKIIKEKELRNKEKAKKKREEKAKLKLKESVDVDIEVGRIVICNTALTKLNSFILPIRELKTVFCLT